MHQEWQVWQLVVQYVDWALGHERYWGTPLPVWECDQCHTQECIGQLAELSQRVGGRDLSDLDYRPHVDELRWRCEKCGEMDRVPIDLMCGFDPVPYLFRSGIIV